MRRTHPVPCILPVRYSQQDDYDISHVQLFIRLNINKPSSYLPPQATRKAQPNTANMQFSFVAALSMASLAAAQGWNGLCIQKGAAACSGEFPKECSTSSGTGVIFTTCCLSTVTCSQP
ncbi:hypothetical protein PG989_004716 [Apiospora arundinis]